MFLQEPEADAILGPVCCKASGFAGIEDPYAFFYLTSNNSFGLVESALEGIGPYKRYAGLQELAEW